MKGFTFIFLILGFGLNLLDAKPVQAEVFSVVGDAQVAQPGTIAFRALKVGQLLPVGCTLRTGDDGAVVLRTTPGAALELGNDSVLKITALTFAKKGDVVEKRTVHVELDSGVVSALADPSTADVNDFKIRTPQGALVARGTFYTVVVRHGKTYASVDEGKIAAIAVAHRSPN